MERSTTLMNTDMFLWMQVLLNMGQTIIMLNIVERLPQMKRERFTMNRQTVLWKQEHMSLAQTENWFRDSRE